MARSPRLLGLMSDERLVQELRRGNERAFETLYDRHVAGLLSFCRHLLGSQAEAEDAVQQSFVSAYIGLLADGRDVNLKPWLFTIARNRCLSMLRARRAEDQVAEPSVAGLDSEVAHRAELRELLGDLQRLPVSQRAALILSELRGFSHRDIGEVLEVPPEKVKSLVFQARTHLLEYREARDTPCLEIRRELASRRRGAPSRRVRDHLAGCPECARFRGAVRGQRAKLAALIPVVPAAALRGRTLAAIGSSTGSAAGAGGGIVAGVSGVKAVVVVAGTAGALFATGSAITQHASRATADPTPAPHVRFAEVPTLMHRGGAAPRKAVTHPHGRRAKGSGHRHHAATPVRRQAAPPRHGTRAAPPATPHRSHHVSRPPRAHRPHDVATPTTVAPPPIPPAAARVPQPNPPAQGGPDGQDGNHRGGRHGGGHHSEGNGHSGDGQGGLSGDGQDHHGD